MGIAESICERQIKLYGASIQMDNFEEMKAGERVWMDDQYAVQNTYVGVIAIWS